MKWALLLLLPACNALLGVHDFAGNDPHPDGALPSSDVAMCGGHDEDADGRPDACDPCPQDPSTGDSDADGVGDACDPHRTTSGDHLLFFDGFGVADPAWSSSGSWAFAMDAVGATGSGSLIRTIPSTTSFAVETTFTLASMTTAQQYVGIAGGQIGCSLELSPDALVVSAASTTVTQPFTIKQGEPIPVRLVVHNGIATCSAGGQLPAQVSLPTDGNAVTTVGIATAFTGSTVVAAAWFAAYASP